MLVAGWADGYRNNSFRTVAALREAGVPHRLLAGPWVHADPTTAYPGPRLDLDVEMVAWFDHWLRGAGPAAGRPGRGVRADGDPTGGLPRPARGLLGPRRLAVHRLVDRHPRPRRSALARGEAGRRHVGVDRLRRPPPVGALRRPARGRRPLPHLRVARRRRGAGRASRGPAAGQRRRSARVALGEAVRRVPRRRLGPGDAGQPRPRLPRRRARAGRAEPAGARAGLRRRRRPRRLRLRVRRPARPSGSRSPGPTGPTRSLPRRR